jgi:hypothetical protein
MFSALCASLRRRILATCNEYISMYGLRITWSGRDASLTKSAYGQERPRNAPRLSPPAARISAGSGPSDLCPNCQFGGDGGGGELEEDRPLKSFRCNTHFVMGDHLLLLDSCSSAAEVAMRLCCATASDGSFLPEPSLYCLIQTGVTSVPAH